MSLESARHYRKWHVLWHFPKVARTRHIPWLWDHLRSSGIMFINLGVYKKNGLSQTFSGATSPSARLNLVLRRSSWEKNLPRNVPLPMGQYTQPELVPEHSHTQQLLNKVTCLGHQLRLVLHKPLDNVVEAILVCYVNRQPLAERRARLVRWRRLVNGRIWWVSIKHNWS